MKSFKIAHVTFFGALGAGIGAWAFSYGHASTGPAVLGGVLFILVLFYSTLAWGESPHSPLRPANGWVYWALAQMILGCLIHSIWAQGFEGWGLAVPILVTAVAASAAIGIDAMARETARELE